MSAELRACVVVPARDEEERVARCVASIARQCGVEPGAYELLLVLDRCTDRTEERVRAAAAAHPGLRLRLLHGPGLGAGPARKVGMDAAADRLLARGRPEGLIACTDADTTVAPDWLRAQLDAVAAGARAIGGRIELDPLEARALAPGVLRLRAEQARGRYERVLATADAALGDRAEHWQFSGASMAVTAATYVAIGGISTEPALEDEAFERRLRAHRVPIVRSLAVRVTTSARLHGRASRGLARDLALADQRSRRTTTDPLLDP